MTIQDKSGVQSDKFMMCGFKGCCMEPLLRDGDILTVKKVEQEEIKLGELVCVERNGQYACHRLIFRRRKYRKLRLYEKPDNFTYQCYYIKPGSVIGKAVKALRGKDEISLGQGLLVRYGFVFRFILSRLAYEMKRRVFS